MPWFMCTCYPLFQKKVITIIFLLTAILIIFKCYFNSGKILMVYRTFYINDIVYSFGVLTLPERDKNKSMKRFFDSVKIK